MDTIQLNNGITMPQQGLGVFQVTDQSVCKESVLTALQTGYRLIDTATVERCVGGWRGRPGERNRPGGAVPHLQGLDSGRGIRQDHALL